MHCVEDAFGNREPHPAQGRIGSPHPILVAALVSFVATPLLAADTTWVGTTSPYGLYYQTANWQGGVIADGTDAVADFTTNNLTADSTVTLDGARTIGNLIFGDTATGTGGSWILTNGTGGPLREASDGIWGIREDLRCDALVPRASCHREVVASRGFA